MSDRLTNQQQNHRLSAQVVDGDDVRSLRASQIADLSALLAIPASRAETLLRAAGWRLDDAALRATDDDGEVSSHRADGAWKPVGNSAATCSVCFDGALDGFCTDCQSVLCAGCWRGYLRAILESGATVVVCPMPACRTVVSLELVTSVLGVASPVAVGEKSDAELLALYASRRVSDYITGSSDLRACPGRDCESIVKRLDGDVASVECGTCHARFCWKCNFEDHWPLDCGHALDWILLATSEMKSQWWILKNTKMCPGCKIPVNKRGGCEHMKCVRCGVDWDWGKEICYKGSVAQGAEERERDEARASRAELLDALTASEKHMRDHKNLSEGKDVGMMMSVCGAFGLDLVQVNAAVSQLLATHRELRWVHMARYYREMTPVDRGVLEVNIKQLEEAAVELKQTLLDELQAESDVTGADWLKDMADKVSKGTLKVSLFRRVIGTLCRDFI